MLSIMLMKHDSELLRQSSSRNTDVFFERRIVVTEHFTDSSRFDLELKTDTKFPVSWQSSVISKATLSTKQHYLHGGPHEGRSQ